MSINLSEQKCHGTAVSLLERLHTKASSQLWKAFVLKKKYCSAGPLSSQRVSDQLELTRYLLNKILSLSWSRPSTDKWKDVRWGLFNLSIIFLHWAANKEERGIRSATFLQQVFEISSWYLVWMQMALPRSLFSFFQVFNGFVLGVPYSWTTLV